ncbi:MAG: hypothetical protein HFK07_04115 [Clostridia bacterium]|jgi:uncharacterized protein Veg|nr:hypothetical protein [Clostridia bacterium]MCX4367653.1 hypothetical protein [Clostridia bacterium]
MKSNIKELEIAKKRIELLAGREVKLRVNEGRNKIKNYVGVVDGMYKAIFTVKSLEDGKLYSYPYSDLITKNVKFYQN